MRVGYDPHDIPEAVKCDPVDPVDQPLPDFIGAIFARTKGHGIRVPVLVRIFPRGSSIPR